MKFTIFGATGGTGRQLVEQALSAGHEVTAVVRDPAKLPLCHERLRTLHADVFDPAALAPALAGSDAVLSALGPRPGDAADICSAGTRGILTAMRASGARRLVAISAAPVAVNDPGDRLLYRLTFRPLIRTLFKRAYADLALMEQEMRQSGLDWTIMRPPRLTDKPRGGRFRTALNRNVTGGLFIARADLATAMLRILDDATTIKATVGIAY